MGHHLQCNCLCMQLIERYVQCGKETVSQASMEIMGEFAELQLSTSEGESDNAICPKCGVYIIL